MKGSNPLNEPSLKDMKVLFFALNNLWQPWMSGIASGIYDQVPHTQNNGDDDAELDGDSNDGEAKIESHEINMADLNFSEQQAVNNEPNSPQVSQFPTFHLHSKEQVRALVARYLELVENRKFHQNLIT